MLPPPSGTLASLRRKIHRSILTVMPSYDGPETGPAPGSGTEPMLAELRAFEQDCERRYRFNNRWDVILTAGGILLGIGVVAAGAYQMSKTTAILGAIVTAILSSQRAFPFGQRAQFYRNLVGQAANLQADLSTNLTTAAAAATTLKSLRLDFAQQLPRGVTAGSETPPS
jgi:hypothetical protein